MSDRSRTRPQPIPDLDTALVLGMASTALPFAPSQAEEAERWLRILRLHGSAGAALQAAGVSEAPLEALESANEDARLAGSGDIAGGAASAGREEPDHRTRIAAVSERAADRASQRGAAAVDSSDVLVAVMHVYGSEFDRVLRVHGTDRDEILERLGAAAAPA